jgi:hypothetical protein
MVAHACDSSSWGGGVRRMEISRPTWAKLAKPYLINKIQTQRAGGVAQRRVLT